MCMCTACTLYIHVIHERALQALTAALASNELGGLQRAAQQAQQARIDASDPMLARVLQAIATAGQARRDADEALTQAVQARRLGALRAAIEANAQHGAGTAGLQQAQAMAAQLAPLHAALEAALAAGGAAEAQAALQAALLALLTLAITRTPTRTPTPTRTRTRTRTPTPTRLWRRQGCLRTSPTCAEGRKGSSSYYR
jgi:hypothetical protein